MIFKSGNIPWSNDKKNCNEDNLITLCRKHHTLMRLNRNWWMLYFANKERI